jgi:hypothetical protein
MISILQNTLSNYLLYNINGYIIGNNNEYIIFVLHLFVFFSNLK